MSPLIVPDPLSAKLAAADAPVELRAPDGQVFRYFTPAKARPPVALDPGESEDELDRPEAAGGSRPLTDILRDLEAWARSRRPSPSCSA